MGIKFWESPSHAHRKVMIGFIIAGFLGILFGICFKDKGIILSSFGVIFIGIIFGGFQSIAWKQWEEQQKRQGKSTRIFPSLEKFLKKRDKN